VQGVSQEEEEDGKEETSSENVVEALLNGTRSASIFVQDQGDYLERESADEWM